MNAFDQLAAGIEGDLDCSSLARRLYSQDASIYEQAPLGVVLPGNSDDCRQIAAWAHANRIPLIPRAGGTSLAGQCVGAGLVVDVSRYMNRILNVDAEGCSARVEPGVVQDDLNAAAAESGLQFAPDTSTSRQALIAGMVGNNSCGAHSILYGTTRDHVIELEAVLSDGSTVRFKQLSPEDLEAKKRLDSLEGNIYRDICSLIDKERDAILNGFPDPRIERRNMGYALDRIARMQPWNPKGESFNLAPLICGSEGTLCLTTEIKVKLVPRPKKKSLLCVHFATVDEACKATPQILQHNPAAIEMMDGMLLDATRGNRDQSANRFWIEGEPEAVLAVEMFGGSSPELEERNDKLRTDLKANDLGYAFREIAPDRMQRVWDLRKAALGLLTGMPGDARPITAIEDTAVAPELLPEYVREVEELMQRNGCECCFYGHAGAGLLHLRPLINLKTQTGLDKFKSILAESADLLKRFNGSLSGEHGDGRLRGRLLKRMLDPEIYDLLVEVKSSFDPVGMMNPGKIVEAPDPTCDLRADPNSRTPQMDIVFDWSYQKGIVRAVERCNGAGFCRQGPEKGTMCPSYMATREEAYTTRGRANVLRQLLTTDDPDSAWEDPDLQTVMSTCLSCKACASECPSSVDMARLKAEYLQKRIERGDASLRDRLFGFYTFGARLAAIAPRLASKVMNLSGVKRILGIAPERTIPPFASETLSAWFGSRKKGMAPEGGKRVLLFNDEFTNYADTGVGKAAIHVLEALGYEVVLTEHLQSGRPLISKGFLKSARKQMQHAVEEMYPYACDGVPIVGLEPSAILGFRDEAPDLVHSDLREHAEIVSNSCCLFEEFLIDELENGGIEDLPLDSLPDEIMLHGHCHQKALAGTSATSALLKMIPNARVTEIPSGCCGMAGSFGYEAEHYELSMQIGELTLFPAIRAHPEAIFCAPGTSCRQQIKDGTGKIAFHPAEIMARQMGGLV